MLSLTSSKIIEIFIDCDDFVVSFNNSLQVNGSFIGTMSSPKSGISASEIMTICILYHHSRMDCFKSYYKLVVLGRLKTYFPDAPSYTHFVKLKEHYLIEMFAFLLSKRLSAPLEEANFIDSKKLESCHLKREKQHKVMQGLATKGKTTTGWFFGLKIHLIINAKGQICKFLVTSGNKADNNEKVLKKLFEGLKGFFYGDKGYLTKLTGWLKEQGAVLITKVKKNMKKPPLTRKEKHYLKHRGLIETVFGLLTFQCDIDHTRHRSQSGFFMNLFSALIAYSYFDILPRLSLFDGKSLENNQFVLIED